jgi:hypothetical protein
VGFGNLIRSARWNPSALRGALAVTAIVATVMAVVASVVWLIANL